MASADSPHPLAPKLIPMDVVGSGPLVLSIESWINVAVLIFALVIEIVALGHCLVQRPDAFPAINTLSKRTWLALTGGSVLVTLLSFLGFFVSLGVMFVMIGIAVVGVYLLDVRPALRDAVDGHGSW
jgi:hypothetical protein